MSIRNCQCKAFHHDCMFFDSTLYFHIFAICQKEGEIEILLSLNEYNKHRCLARDPQVQIISWAYIALPFRAPETSTATSQNSSIHLGFYEACFLFSERTTWGKGSFHLFFFMVTCIFLRKKTVASSEAAAELQCTLTGPFQLSVCPELLRWF